MKILVILENNFNDIELTTTLSCIKRADSSAEIDYYHKELKEARGQYGIGYINHIINKPDNVDSYDAVFVPGGKGAQTLRENKDSLNVVQKFIQNQKYVFAICDAPNVLVEANVLTNKKFAAFPSEWSSSYRQNNYVKDVYVVESDSKIVTAKAADASMELGYYIVKHLYGKDLANKVYQGMTGNTNNFFE